MLQQAELNALVDVVVARLDTVRLSAHVSACGRSVESITVPLVWPALARKVLEDADNQAWMVDLLDVVLGDPQTGPTLRDACQHARALCLEAQRAAEPLAPAGRRAHALVLFNKAPFIDRAQARPLVDEAVQLAGRRVLVVRGRQAVGKSHLSYFVRHLVGVMPQTRMVSIRLDELDVERVHAVDLMVALAESMGLPPDPAWDTLAQESRQADKLVRWLVGKLNAGVGNGTHWVIVIDEVDHAKVAPGAVDLVNRLVMAAARGELLNTSLIVLALPGEVPPGVADDVMEQELPPLTSQELRTHVVELARTLGRAAQPQALDAMVDFVLDGLQFPLDRAGMETVRRRTTQLYNEILQVAA